MKWQYPKIQKKAHGLHRYGWRDWQGKKRHKKKRGFASKKEALEWERNTLLASKTDMNMKLMDFVEVYFKDKDGGLKQCTIRYKRCMINITLFLC